MSSIERTKEIMMNVDVPTFTSWITPSKNYVEQGNLPLDHAYALLVKKRDNGYIVVRGILYKRGLSIPHFKMLRKCRS